jgi:1-acyl-sn-glycerol-3-phosphate acyltransferase
LATGTHDKAASNGKPADSDGSGAESGSEHGGIRGLIDDRTSDWSVAAPNKRFIDFQQPVWNLLVDRYFRMEVDGWDRLPEPPVMLIGIHASGMLPIDAYAFGYQWFRRFGSDRVANGTAHDFLMAMPGIGHYLRAIGTVPAGRESITAALNCGHDVIIYPGGDLDSLRPWLQRDKVVLGGRKGFVRQAIRAKVPIVPFAQVGGPDTMPVLTTGKRVAKLLQFDKLMRSEVFPLAVGFPLGIAPGVIPQIPLPAKLRTEILEPVWLDPDPKRENDDEYVEEKYEEIEGAIQAGVDRLAKKRRFPIFF